MEFDIFIPGGGRDMVYYLNAVAMYANANGLGLAVKIALAVGCLYMMALAAIQKAKMTDIFIYVLGVFVFTSVAINTRVTAKVYDEVHAGYNGIRVDNVPLGLAAILSITTKMEYAATRGTEAVFSTVGDLKYTQTGMIFAQDMIIRASRETIVDSELRDALSAFVQQCVMYDVQLGHYSLNDLMNAEDIWQFMKTNANSKSRAFQYRGDWKTCFSGTLDLDTALTQETDSAVLQFARRAFPEQDANKARALVFSMLPITHEHIIGISRSATDILKQNMVINLMYDAVENYSAKTDSDAAMSSYISARADLQTMYTNSITGAQTGKWLSYSRVVFVLFLSGSFVLIAPFATLPGGMSKFVKTYAGLFFMISLWGPMYAILNSMMTNNAVAETQAIASGLSALTQPGIVNVQARIATQAAQYAGYIPYIAMVLTGIGGAIGHMIQSSLGPATNAASSVAQEITTGNISLGNTTQGTHAFNSMTGNTWDTSGSYRGSSMFTGMGTNGIQQTQFGNGTTAFDTSNAYSRLESANLFSRNAVSNTLSAEGQRMIDAGKSESAQWQERKGAALQGSITNAVNQYENRNTGNNWRYGDDSKESTAVRNLNNVAKEYSKQFGVSEEEARSQVLSAYASFKVGGSIGPIGAETGGRAEGSQSSRTAETESQNWIEKRLQSEEFSKSMETLFNVGKDSSASESKGTGLDERTSFAENYDMANARIDEANARITQGESYKQAAAQIETSNFELGQNRQQDFVNWLQDQGYSSTQLNQLFTPEKLDEIRPLAAQYLRQESESLFQEWKEKYQGLDDKYIPTSRGAVESQHQDDKEGINNGDPSGKLMTARALTADARDMDEVDTTDTKKVVESVITTSQTEISAQKPTPIEDEKPPTADTKVIQEEHKVAGYLTGSSGASTVTRTAVVTSESQDRSTEQQKVEPETKTLRDQLYEQLSNTQTTRTAMTEQPSGTSEVNQAQTTRTAMTEQPSGSSEVNQAQTTRTAMTEQPSGTSEVNQAQTTRTAMTEQPSAQIHLSQDLVSKVANLQMQIDSNRGEKFDVFAPLEQQTPEQPAPVEDLPKPEINTDGLKRS
ncbi:conjugal transfer protein TraG N-terminal domain-containing protein [Enterovibrio paralichthyis]|uniref:conjugal transfer protein TraG N-terminal domain-containing protein n=1 Tax=Enterovibrio paralichthyis TaxID=2853805 RepID=UPI001C48B643|nr:conjugal transfer protein TraG N-terminal domain-containing protein [Enterovibrio paralichthyis]MBV7300283.1 conjugal transfer protein TraG N-terminal domain-containing protein [Enterovibrio paralichthyis]